MEINKIFNFSAGPAMLPLSVLHRIKKELYNWNNLGISVMEVSHRGKEFLTLAENVIESLRIILEIPLNYTVLLCHGGARAQFSAIPMNLLKSSSVCVDYVNTGYWSHSAAVEARKYCNTRIISAFDHYTGNIINSIKPMHSWDISDDSVYVHYCPNETINGIAVNEDPNFKDKVVIADCSSTLLSRPLDISRFGIVYAAAQKNIGISGVTIVIIRNDLIKRARIETPSILSYEILRNNCSMFNTPSTIAWYIMSLVLVWLRKQGGLKKMHEYNQEKARFLYTAIDDSDFYYNNVDYQNRSYMNVVFFLKNAKFNDLFLKESMMFGLYGLQGHRAVGGMRASLYNAMSIEGVKRLVEFMNLFSRKYS